MLVKSLDITEKSLMSIPAARVLLKCRTPATRTLVQNGPRSTNLGPVTSYTYGPGFGILEFSPYVS